VRAWAPREMVIGRSVHASGEARTATAAGELDYLVFGTVFPSASKPPDHVAAGVAALSEVVAAVPSGVPVLAIGGMTLAALPEVARAGAAGIAAIGLFLPEHGRFDRMSEVVARCRSVFDTFRTVS
jgi:thiamine-phosphate pyrophosphorylase